MICTVDNIDEAFIDAYIDSVSQIRWIQKEYLASYRDMMIRNIAMLDSKSKKSWAREQAHIALWNLSTSLAHMRIDLCPIAWFDNEAYDEILWLKEEWLSSCLVCPIWYRSEDDDYIKLPKVRFEKDKLFIKK